MQGDAETDLTRRNEDGCCGERDENKMAYFLAINMNVSCVVSRQNVQLNTLEVTNRDCIAVRLDSEDLNNK